MTFFLKSFRRCKCDGSSILGNSGAGNLICFVSILRHCPLNFITIKTIQSFRIEFQYEFFASVAVKQNAIVPSTVTVVKVQRILQLAKNEFFSGDFLPTATFFHISLCKNRHADLVGRFSPQFRETSAIC